MDSNKTNTSQKENEEPCSKFLILFSLEVLLSAFEVYFCLIVVNRARLSLVELKSRQKLKQIYKINVI